MTEFGAAHQWFDFSTTNAWEDFTAAIVTCLINWKNTPPVTRRHVPCIRIDVACLSGEIILSNACIVHFCVSCHFFVLPACLPVCLPAFFPSAFHGLRVLLFCWSRDKQEIPGADAVRWSVERQSLLFGTEARFSLTLHQLNSSPHPGDKTTRRLFTAQETHARFVNDQARCSATPFAIQNISEDFDCGKFVLLELENPSHTVTGGGGAGHDGLAPPPVPVRSILSAMRIALSDAKANYPGFYKVPPPEAFAASPREEEPGGTGGKTGGGDAGATWSAHLLGVSRYPSPDAWYETAFLPLAIIPETMTEAERRHEHHRPTHHQVWCQDVVEIAQARLHHSQPTQPNMDAKRWCASGQACSGCRTDSVQLMVTQILTRDFSCTAAADQIARSQCKPKKQRQSLWLLYSSSQTVQTASIQYIHHSCSSNSSDPWRYPGAKWFPLTPQSVTKSLEEQSQRQDATGCEVVANANVRIGLNWAATKVPGPAIESLAAWITRLRNLKKSEKNIDVAVGSEWPVGGHGGGGSSANKGPGSSDRFGELPAAALCTETSGCPGNEGNHDLKTTVSSWKILLHWMGQPNTEAGKNTLPANMTMSKRDIIVAAVAIWAMGAVDTPLNVLRTSWSNFLQAFSMDFATLKTRMTVASASNKCIPDPDDYPCIEHLFALAAEWERGLDAAASTGDMSDHPALQLSARRLVHLSVQSLCALIVMCAHELLDTLKPGDTDPVDMRGSSVQRATESKLARQLSELRRVTSPQSAAMFLQCFEQFQDIDSTLSTCHGLQRVCEGSGVDIDWKSLDEAAVTRQGEEAAAAAFNVVCLAGQ